MKNTNFESPTQFFSRIQFVLRRGSEALNDQQWIAALQTRTKQAPLLVYRPTPPLRHLPIQDIKPGTRFKCTYLGFLGMVADIPTNLSWELLGLLLVGAGIAAFYINSKIKQSFDSELKVMVLAAQDILVQGINTKDIKSIKDQVDRIRQNLEVKFQSKNASIPEDLLVDLFTSDELYKKVQLAKSLREKVEALEELEAWLKAFHGKYKEFILGDSEKVFAEFNAWVKVSLNLIMAKGLIVNSSFQEDETSQLISFYFGVLQYLEIVESYLNFFTEEGRNLARNMAREIINYKPYKNLTKKVQYAEEKTNFAIALVNAAKAILWEIETYEKNISEKHLPSETILEFAENSPGWINDNLEENLIDSTPKKTQVAKKQSSRFRPPSGRSLERHAGAWVGNDIEECLQKVRETRSIF